MPVLSIGKPLETQRAALRIDNQLAPGPHRFSLVVVDDDGNESTPDVLVVTVRRVVVRPPVPLPPRPLPTPRTPTEPPTEPPIRLARAPAKKGSAR